jgi:uncharacterized protein YcfJ
MATKPHPNLPPAPRDANRDPITGAPGSHPVGTSIGAAAGGATGAAIGAGAGPVGAAVGAVVGAVIGGLAGKGVAEGIDPTTEDAYWREKHPTQPYADDEQSFEKFASAYRTGYMGYRTGQSFEEREADLRAEYEGSSQETSAANKAGTQASASREAARLKWEEARLAIRAAYERLEREQFHKPGDPDPMPPNPGQIG